MSLTFGSLFTGFGGLDLGLERAGLVCKWQVEINPYARQVLEKRFPGVPKFVDAEKFCRRAGDCLKPDGEGEVFCPRCEMDFGECDCVGTDELIDQCGSVDIVCGGDPCQENSNSRRNGETLCPSLGGEFIRIIDQLRPGIVLRENPSVVRKDAPWPWKRFRKELIRMGYAVLPFRLRACCVGVDFRRDRLFLLAELPGTYGKRLERDVGQVLADAIEGGQHADITRPDRWSASPRICGKADRVPDRVERLRGLGNSIPPVMGEFIGRMILNGIQEERN